MKITRLLSRSSALTRESFDAAICLSAMLGIIRSSARCQAPFASSNTSAIADQVAPQPERESFEHRACEIPRGEKVRG